MIIKKIYLYLLFGLPIAVFSQNLDSLYAEFMIQNSYSEYVSQIELVDETPVKCGFGIFAQVKEHLNEFTYEQQQSIEKILQRPDLQTSIVSPSGFFRVHFDTSGYDIPGYDVSEFAIALDSAYNYEVNILGYPEPPKDGIAGGDDKYDVYITSAAGGYGATFWEDSVGNIGNTTQYNSYIKVHNNFNNFYTTGINAARVTAAHEFHHAIQVGNYIVRSSDFYYYELTSTSMEEFVYDSINDYYNYMKSYFKNPTRRFTRFSGSNDGYDLAIWNIFLHEKFGDGTPNEGDEIIKRSWELMRDKNYRAIVAIQNALHEYGYKFSDMFKEFGVWCYFTGYRTKENTYFDEAANYPLIKSTENVTLTSSIMPLTIISEPASLNYISIVDYSQGIADSITAELSNSDVEGTLTDDNSTSIEFTLDTNPFSGSTSISEKYFVKIDGEKSNYIGNSYIINNELASNYITRTTTDFVYPQPFRYDKYESISIPTNADLSGNSDLYIYSSDMNLVYNGVSKISSSGQFVVTWNGLSNKGKRLASGVYIFVTKAGGKIKKGKLVILN